MSRELRVRNFSAKFLCIRQAAVSTALGWTGRAAWSRPGTARTSPAACGRPAWRPLSEALDTHEIITWGATVVVAAVTLLCSGTRAPRAGPHSERALSLCLSRHPAEGARRERREEGPVPVHRRG